MVMRAGSCVTIVIVMFEVLRKIKNGDAKLSDAVV